MLTAVGWTASRKVVLGIRQRCQWLDGPAKGRGTHETDGDAEDGGGEAVVGLAAIS